MHQYEQHSATSMPPVGMAGLQFDQSVPDFGYAWWYIDALSDDGRHGLTLIAFIGSVFSPYYAWSRRCGRGDPFDHCAINIGLYNADGKRWAMTERGRDQIFRDTASLVIGPSAVCWDGNKLVVNVDEITAPFPSRIRGRVTLHPAALINHCVALDAGNSHFWQPIAPCARVEVALSSPSLQWSGSGYLDSNRGNRPLEDAFSGWDWSRAELPGGDSAVLYEVARRDGDRFLLAQRFGIDGRIEDFTPPPSVSLPASAWRVSRRTLADPGHPSTVLRSLEDGPFYVRSVVNTHVLGHQLRSVHESLSLDRFRSPVVQMMLPFRMPRRA
jgi:carotenoid 1,2-hydratase